MTEGKHETAMDAQTVPFRALKACVNFRAGDFLPSCRALGAEELHLALEAAFREEGITLPLQKVHCMGRCHLGPTLRLVPNGPYFLGLQAKDAARLASFIAEGDIAGAAAAFPEPVPL